MNVIDKRVLKKINQYGKISQRQLSDVCGFSLGKVNQSIQFLQKEEYIDEEWNLTEKSTKLIDLYKSNKKETLIKKEYVYIKTCENFF